MMGLDFLAGRLRPRRPEFPLYHISAILSRVFAKKVAQIKIPIFVQHSILIFCLPCAIIIIVRGTEGVSQRPKKNSKKFEKLLDKYHKVCYNKDVKRTRVRTAGVMATLTRWTKAKKK